MVAKVEEEEEEKEKEEKEEEEKEKITWLRRNKGSGKQKHSGMSI